MSSLRALVRWAPPHGDVADQQRAFGVEDGQVAALVADVDQRGGPGAGVVQAVRGQERVAGGGGVGLDAERLQARLAQDVHPRLGELAVGGDRQPVAARLAGWRSAARGRARRR